MLTFTSSEPFSVIFQAMSDEPPPAPLVERRSPVVIGLEDKFLNIYIHGDAEAAAGFDIPKIIDGTLEMKEGELDCVLELPSKSIPCIAVLWNTSSKATTVEGKRVEVWKGLIVSKEDAKSLAYARKLATEKAFCM